MQDPSLSAPDDPPQPALEHATGAFPVEFAQALRAAAPQTITRIVTEIQQQVRAYAGPDGGDRQRVVLTTVDAAVNHFLDAVEKVPTDEQIVLDLVRQLSSAEAADGHPIDALRTAHHIATRVARQDIRRLGDAAGLDRVMISMVVDLMFAYVEQLIDQVAAGHNEATRPGETNSQLARRQVLSALLSGQTVEGYTEHLADADWVPPSDIIVVTATLDGSTDFSHPITLRPDVLSGVNPVRMTAIAEPLLAKALAHDLFGTSGVECVAISWVMPVDKTCDAYRWTDRALDLAQRRLIDASQIIDCAQHRQLLWLYADPELSRHAGDELLAPLLGKKAHQRLVLAETLMLWLQARESAPVLGKRLGIHPNTVRGRLRHLKELFGEQLADPQQTLALLSALEVIVPLWREDHPTQRIKPRDAQ